jgi:NAD(P)H-nitrite reductase large subunit
MSQFLVSKCICHKRDFTEVKEYAEANDYATVEELQADDFCSCSCGLCIPYIHLMFKTGETEFEPGAYYKRKAEAE